MQNKTDPCPSTLHRRDCGTVCTMHLSLRPAYQAAVRHQSEPVPREALPTRKGVIRKDIPGRLDIHTHEQLDGRTVASIFERNSPSLSMSCQSPFRVRQPVHPGTCCLAADILPVTYPMIRNADGRRPIFHPGFPGTTKSPRDRTAFQPLPRRHPPPVRTEMPPCTAVWM